MTKLLSCFKAYDIRGRIPDELNTDIAYRIGRAYAENIQPKRVIVGRDIRLSSNEMADAVIQGLQDAGVNVLTLVCAALKKFIMQPLLIRMQASRWTAVLW